MVNIERIIKEIISAFFVRLVARALTTAMYNALEAVLLFAAIGWDNRTDSLLL